MIILTESLYYHVDILSCRYHYKVLPIPHLQRRTDNYIAQVTSRNNLSLVSCWDSHLAWNMNKVLITTQSRHENKGEHQIVYWFSHWLVEKTKLARDFNATLCGFKFAVIKPNIVLFLWWISHDIKTKWNKGT